MGHTPCPFLILWPACSLFSQHPHSRHGSGGCHHGRHCRSTQLSFFCKGTQPDTACHFTLNCGLQAAPRIYSELVHYTFGIHQGRASAQTDVHTAERKDSGPHAAEPGSSRASVYPPHGDQIAFAIGRECADRDAERIRKGRKTKY